MLKMLKKSLALLLSVCILITCFVFPGFAAVTDEEAAQIALADAELSLADSFNVSNIAVESTNALYNEKDEFIGYLSIVGYETGSLEPYYYWDFPDFEQLVYVISPEGEIDYCWVDCYLEIDEDAVKVYYCRYPMATLWLGYADGTLANEYGEVCERSDMNKAFEESRAYEAELLREQEMEELLDSTDSLSDVFENFKKLDFERFVQYFIELIQRICYYVLNGRVSFVDGWNKTEADASVDAALEEYCKENNAKVTAVYRVDKDYFVPNEQTYFSDGEDVGAGVCGVASWEMILGGYRDSGVLSKLPDDITMYREIMAVMDDISDDLQPLITNFLKTNEPLIDGIINPVMIDTIGMYIDKDFEFNSYEIIGTLDIGIAMYLNQYGYTEYARRVLSNLSISLPVLTPAKRTLLMNDLRNEISGWISEKTDGKLTIPASCGGTAVDTVLRSLEKGEPAIFGCWASILGDDHLTNHYFVISSLFKVEAEVKISDTKSVTIERNLVEVYDTWDNNSVELVDFDALYRTTISDANSLALLF